MRVSVICTVLDEGDSVRRLLDSLLTQTRPADEVVITDGGSRDNTLAVIQEYADRLPIRVLAEPGANISRGRNLAIRAATGEVIASTDAGVWLEPRWLEHLICDLRLTAYDSDAEVQRPATGNGPSSTPALALSRDPGARFGSRDPEHSSAGASAVHRQSVAGFFTPDPHTPFEVAMGATVLPTVQEVRPEKFLPSSRSVAFTKSAWAAAGGYPEWLDYCEDLIFDLRLLDVAGPFGWAPEAIAHFRPRGSLRAFFRQYYRYARGDGKADLWRKRHVVRYVAYLIALPAVLILTAVQSPLWFLALLSGALLYCRTPYRRLRSVGASLRASDRLHAILLVPVIRGVGDVAKMLGYPAGWAWRIANWSRPEIHWRGERRET